MTNEQINKINTAIAEACGWTDCSNIDGTLCGLPIGVTSLKGRYDIIPDYCNDLNAMHEAEISLTADQWYKYDSMMPLRDPQKIHANARQRAEAFLKTIGKWVETPVTKFFSTTPETDVAEYYIQGEGNYVRSDISRKLERERGEANTKLQDVSSKLADALRERDEARAHWGTESMNAAQFFGEKTKAIYERDEARKELEEYRSMTTNHYERLLRERDEAWKQLRIAVGLLSTLPQFANKHPEDVLAFVKEGAK